MFLSMISIDSCMIHVWFIAEENIFVVIVLRAFISSMIKESKYCSDLMKKTF